MTPQENITMGALLLLLLFGSLLVILIIERLERLLTRYRLKYGFDREIESKEIKASSKEESEEKLNRRERYFKRRAFKD